MRTRPIIAVTVLTVSLGLSAALVGCSDDDAAPEVSMSASTSSTAPEPTTTSQPTTAPPTTATTAPPTTTVAPGSSIPPPSDGSATTPADAVAVWMVGQGYEYAGDCVSASLDTDIGKYCSRVVADRGTEVVYEIGPTFSEFTTYLLVRQEVSGWVVAETAPLGGAPPW